MPDDSTAARNRFAPAPERSISIPSRTAPPLTSDDTDLGQDVRHLIELIQTLLDRGSTSVAEPIEKMLADLEAIQGHMSVCATAMLETARIADRLLEREDPMPELARLHARLDGLGWGGG